MESLLSASCRTQYPDLERYLCLGCNPEQARTRAPCLAPSRLVHWLAARVAGPQFLYTTESTIRICESFAQR